MKKNVMKKVVAVCAIATMVMGSTAMSFADTKDTPVKMTVAVTPIDFSISEAITAEATAEDTDGLIYSDLVVTNNSEMGVLQVTDVAAATEDSGWTLKADTTEWNKEPANAKTFSMVTENGQDLSAGSDKNVYDLNPTASDEVSFTGHTGMVTTAVSAEKVADVTVTVGYKTAN